MLKAKDLLSKESLSLVNPNRMKKQTKDLGEGTINEVAHYKQFVKYMNDFYGPKGIYPDKKKRTLKMKDIGTAYSVLLKKNPNFEIGYDSTDREMLRDILIKMRKLDPDYSQKEYMNTQLKKKKKRGLDVEAFDKMEMHKLQTAIKMFQNKIKKQGRVTNARDEDHLKNLIKIYKQMGGKKIKESVNERMDKRQAGEMLKQLGGNKFIAMTGAKNFAVGPKGASFKIGRNSKNVNYVRIDLKNDLYDMEFIQMRAGKMKVKSKVKQIYADQLQQMFTKHTGMYTSL
jgi:hypothetical protein